MLVLARFFRKFGNLYCMTGKNDQVTLHFWPLRHFLPQRRQGAEGTKKMPPR
jgi:hypothetical protein